MRHAVLLWSVMILTALPASAAVTEDQARRLAAKMIQKHHLSNRSLRCLDIVTEDDDWRFSVRERHEGDCWGDPHTSPRLFDMLVDRNTGVVQAEVLEEKEGDISLSFRRLK